jgi:tetratricopeptide (TPR) repeat protein
MRARFVITRTRLSRRFESMVRPRFEVILAARLRVLLLVACAAFAFGLSAPFGLAPGDACAAAPAGGAAKPAAPAAAKATKPAVSAKAALTAKAVPDSLPRLEAAVKRDSTNAKALYRLGIAYLDRDRATEAARMFQKAVISKPDYVEAWVNLGAAEDAEGHGGMARTHYRQALVLRPDDEIAMCRLASSFYAVGIRDSAMGVLREQIKKNPKSHCAYFTLGVAFADAGMFRDAIQAWQQVVANAPTSPEAESAGESIKLLQEYLGPQEAISPASAQPGIPLGAGGPGLVIPGGGMHDTGMTEDQKKAAEKLTKKANSEDMKEAHGTKDQKKSGDK